MNPIHVSELVSAALHATVGGRPLINIDRPIHFTLTPEAEALPLPRLEPHAFRRSLRGAEARRLLDDLHAHPTECWAHDEGAEVAE